MLRFVIILLLTWAVGLKGIANTPDSAYVELHYNIYQKLTQADSTKGAIFIHEDQYINELINLHAKLGKEQGSFSGFRIQIFSGNSYDYPLEEVVRIKELFEEQFPEIPVYLNYLGVDYKIRAGNFKNRLESIPALKIIRKEYPVCYPVRTNIPFTDLSPKKKEECKEEASATKTEEETTGSDL